MQTLVDDLTNGTAGATVRFPRHWESVRATAQRADFVDPQTGVSWSFGLFDVALDLSPGSDALLRADLERHTRDLFESCFRMEVPIPNRPVQKEPRTADPRWSPVVELERLTLGSAPALRVIHRLWYQPCHEGVMGHVLVPLRKGLLEVRISATDTVTGFRESTLAVAAFTRNPGKAGAEVLAALGPGYFDDRAHDALFPRHALSRVRAALDLIAGGALTVTEAAPASSGECSLDGRSVFTLPARYLPIGGASNGVTRTCTRLTFAGTDGVEFLKLVRLPPTASGISILEDATANARRNLAEGKSVVDRVEQLPPREGRSQIRTYRVSAGGAGTHTVLQTFEDSAGCTVGVALTSSQCVSEAELAERAASVCANYRVLDPTPPPSPDSKGAPAPAPLASPAPPAASARSARPWWRLW